MKTQGMLKTLSNVWWGVFYRALCNTGIFRTRGTFRALSNIYYGEFYSKPSITLSYLNTWHIQNPSYILNTAKYLSWNIVFKALCNPETLVLSKVWPNPELFIFQPLLSIWATELLIMHAIVDIWQNFRYGLPVKRKEKYLYIRKKVLNKIPRKNGLFKVTSTWNRVWLPN